MDDTQMQRVEIGEIIGKEHKTILRDIRNEIKQLGTEKGENNFVLIYYKDKSNRSQPMYNITKIGALQLAARYDAVVRYNFEYMKIYQETLFWKD